MRALFIYEELFYPFDEGMKKFSSKIYQSIGLHMNVQAIKDIRWLPAGINSLLIVPRILWSNLVISNDVIVYIPKQSLTFFSLLKAFILYLFFRRKLRTIGLQRRNISGIKASILKRLSFGKVYVLSHAMRNDLKELNIDTEVIFTGIDTNRFVPSKNKSMLRKKYNIPEGKTVILHVGHIKESRNLELLMDINSNMDSCQVVIVGSTATEQDLNQMAKCNKAGVIVFNTTIDEIQELYGLSDIYCFPVLNDSGAMETPLSVLEAMSVNLPVITTRFGQLPELFEQDDHFIYINSSSDISDCILQKLLSNSSDNRQKVKQFTWGGTAERILSK